MILKTNIDGLVLRNYTLEDSGLYSSYASNYNIWKFFRDEFTYPYTKDKAEEYIAKTCINNENNFFAISLNGKLIGDIHVAQQTDVLKLSGFLGYWLAEDFWGKGFMTESVKVITNYIFENTELIRIFARVFSNNYGSIKVLEKAGYIQEGYFKNAIVKEGKIYDQLQFAALKE
ncbi:GNAT family N-acetyltransferase [Acetivibrio cellulolyticus]|uniref:GNAT family N-acetyltransferase n=1 Tax=Acetivibrio cellulolyticus TaxID=35830 RepID=UPI0001E2C7E2|nr:GNAT family protein [Acetivibrio cellulolyticus]